MAYTNLYESTDISAVIIDILVGLGVFFVGFVAVFGIVMLWRYVKHGKLL